jgi:acetyl-CoA carboxylase carboxyltransferase component
VPYDDPERCDELLDTLVPTDSTLPYDMRQLISSVSDRGSFLEVQSEYAPNAIVGFARLDGYAVGIVANQPLHIAGVLDIDSADKIADFVRFCDAFNLPLITFVDCPGYLPGVEQEHRGIIRHGAKIIYAYCEATVPKISLVVRKAIGGAYIAMSSKQMGTDLAYAWPMAEIAVMGPEGAVNILYHNEIAHADDPQMLRNQLVEEYTQRFYNPYAAEDMGQIDEIIEPCQTRRQLITALEILRSKVASNPAKKHGLMPT